MHDDDQGPKKSYKIGFGKPPQNSRFKLGKSGNPNGRPKGAKNKPPQDYERLRQAILKEAYREVKVRDGGQYRNLSFVEATLRSVSINAAKGNLGSQKLLLNWVSTIEGEKRREHAEHIEAAGAYKWYWQNVLKSYEVRGIKDYVPPSPHPDHIILEPWRNDVRIAGPTTEAERELWDNLHACVALGDEMIEILKGKPDTLPPEAWKGIPRDLEIIVSHRNRFARAILDWGKPSNPALKEFFYLMRIAREDRNREGKDTIDK